jgi:pimeloyl-ACP methyl ester carboxylesterase
VASVLLATVAILLAVDALVHLVVARVALPVFEEKLPAFPIPVLDAPAAEDVCFPSRDGFHLRGTLYRGMAAPPRGLIVFCPEMDSDSRSAPAYCQGLLDAGFHVFAFDFRNQGRSDRMPDYDPLHWLTDYEVADTLAAFDWVETRPDLRLLPLGIFGVSRGGGAALAAAARNARVRCVVADGAFSLRKMMMHHGLNWARLYVPQPILRLIPNWHVDLTTHLVGWWSGWQRNCRYVTLEHWMPALSRRHVLMISGSRDAYVVPEITRQLHRLIDSSDASVWIVPGAKHNSARIVQPVEYHTRLVEFFSAIEPQRKPIAEPVVVEEVVTPPRRRIEASV